MKNAPLASLCSFLNGGTPSKKCPEYFQGDIPWISSADIVDGEVTEPRNKITKEAIEESATNLVPKGTILLVTRTGVGKVTVAPFDLCFSQDITAIIPKQRDKFLPDYLAYFLQSCESGLKSQQRGATIQGITRDALTGLNVPLLSIDQQELIVNRLRLAKRLRNLRQSTILELDNYLRSLFVEMFGDPVTNSKGLPTKKLPDVGNLARGKSKHRPRNAPELFGGPYPFIQTGNITNAHLFVESYDNTYSEAGLKQSKLWPQNTLAITIAANIAFAAIVKFESCFPDSVVAFEPGKEIIKEYALIWLSFLQKSLEASAPQSAQKNINLGILSELQIPVPPIEQQELFKASFYQIFEMMTKQRASERDLKNLFDSLLKEAFH